MSIHECFKYSNLSYYKEGSVTYIKQDICFSRGINTRYFEITEYKIKSSFEFRPFDNSTRSYFKWNYNNLDGLEKSGEIVALTIRNAISKEINFR